MVNNVLRKEIATHNHLQSKHYACFVIGECNLALGARNRAIERRRSRQRFVGFMCASLHFSACAAK